MLIERDLAPKLERAALNWPAVTLTGPRQSGKTTLCRAQFPHHRHVSLEDPDMRQFAAEDPRGFLAQVAGGAVIDEVQRVPGILSYLQGVIDADPAPGRWILTGSHNLALMESVSQSLAGRSAVLHLLPLARNEVLRFDEHPRSLEGSLLAGGFPRIFDRGLDPSEWLASYVSTYLERDVRIVRNVGSLAEFQRFVQLCAGRTAQLLNYASLANDCGVSQPTAKSWLSILEAGFVVFRLPAWHSNLRRRLVKMPKLHFYDTGLVCWLLGIRNADQLVSHPLRGSIFESWVVSEIVKHRSNRGLTGGVAHFRDRSGTEADLVVRGPDAAAVVEAKSSATPSSTMLASARRVCGIIADAGLNGEPLAVYAGAQAQFRSDGAIVPWHELHRAPSASGLA